MSARGREEREEKRNSPKGVVHRWRILRRDPSSCFNTKQRWKRGEQLATSSRYYVREDREPRTYSSFVVDEHFDVSERLAIQHEVLSLSNRIVDIKVLLTEKVLIEVELFEVPSSREADGKRCPKQSQLGRVQFEKTDRRDSRDDPTQRRKHQRLIHRRSDGLGVSTEISIHSVDHDRVLGGREEVGESVEGVLRGSERLDGDPDAGGGKHGSKSSHGWDGEVALEKKTKRHGVRGPDQRRGRRERDEMKGRKRDATNLLVHDLLGSKLSEHRLELGSTHVVVEGREREGSSRSIQDGDSEGGRKVRGLVLLLLKTTQAISINSLSLSFEEEETYVPTLIETQ